MRYIYNQCLDISHMINTVGVRKETATPQHTMVNTCNTGVKRGTGQRLVTESDSEILDLNKPIRL